MLVDTKRKRVAVVIPSRTQPQQSSFLEAAIGSIHAQAMPVNLEIEVVVCLDNGADRPKLSDERSVKFVEASERGQAAALNAGATQVDADYLSFLEDDDTWQPERIAVAIQALYRCDFTSTTQLERDQAGRVLRINDFPTPSGWVMPMSSWEIIGPFDTSYRWHLDNEWLGRLGASGLRRLHVVDAKAPVEHAVAAQVRPWLVKCLQFGGPNIRLVRHNSASPLVNRMVHTNSGSATISLEAGAKVLSTGEYERLVARFGHIPW